jgi:hypothetical protein
VSELEEVKTLVTLLRHRRQVSHLLRELAREFERRAELHDLSVLELDEFEGRVQIQNIARTHKYDSPEYRQSLKETSLNLHYERNDHHPEHYSNGVDEMGFTSFVEMVLDWLGASRTYRNTSFRDGLTEQTKRFKLQPDHLYLIDLIARHFGE